jgi:hypothetical protein
MHLELATGCGESAAAHMRDVIAESLSALNAQRVLKDDDKWKSKILHPKRSERACLVGWMKRDKEGWNGVILVFMVFGWKASFDVSGEGQQMWDEPILEKIEDELIPRPRTARIPPARLSLTTLTPPASSRQQRRVLLQTSTVAPGDEARLLQASQCHLLALVAREHLCSAVSHHTASTMGFSSVAVAALVADFVSASVTTSKSLMNGTTSTTTSPPSPAASAEQEEPGANRSPMP